MSFIKMTAFSLEIPETLDPAEVNVKDFVCPLNLAEISSKI